LQFPLLWDYFKKEQKRAIKRTVIQAISKLGTQKDIPELWEYFHKEPEQSVRRTIIKAVGKLGNQDDIFHLRKLLLKSPGYTARGTALDAINNIYKRNAKHLNIDIDIIQNFEKGTSMNGNNYYVSVSGDLVQGDKIAGDKILLTITHYPLANEEVLASAATVKNSITKIQETPKKETANGWFQKVMSAFTEEASKQTAKEALKYCGQLFQILQKNPEAQAALLQIQEVLHHIITS